MLLKKHWLAGLRIAVAAAALTAIGAGVIGTAHATDPRQDLFDKFTAATKGKKVAWVPVWLGVLESEWTRVMKANFDNYGIEFTMRDPNFKSDVQLQAVSTLINEKPDILIVQNPTTTLLARELKRAMDSGIKVIQVNMSSNTTTDAYVGADVPHMGKLLAQEAVAACGGGKGSGKVAILQGEATAAYSLDMTKAATEVLEADSSMKIVSSQPVNWDANKASEVMTNVLQQNPDLCAVISVWGPQTAGAAQVIKNAGKEGQIKVFVASDGQPADCDMLEQGLYTKNLSYTANLQGEAIVNAVLALLQDDRPAGTTHYAFYTTNYWVSGPQDRQYCFVVPKE
ncbi:sugar ABC transporter substrate-binding protein [Hypericibacter sp.]|uniref:sugar ABC transporter substrate-binding protein n=1 Tax=Hypericibacter sp. TaxID=2705401 RepID=UPI003D6D45BB